VPACRSRFGAGRVSDQWTEDRRQMTENRRQKAEDRKEKKQNSGQALNTNNWNFVRRQNF